MAAVQSGEGLSYPGPSRFSANTSDDAGSSSTHAASRPLAARVRSVLLQAPRESNDISEALQMLAKMYPAAPTQDGANTDTPADKVHSKHATLNGKATTTSTTEQLQLVDTARARRDLDKDIRQRMLSATDNIIAVLQTVDNGLVRLSDDVAAMHASCDAVQDKLRAAEESSRYLVEHAEGLERQRAAALTQVQVAKLFLSRFTLSEAERASIYSREVRVGNDLFQAMDKLERIRSECQILLQGSESLASSHPASSSSSAVANAGGGTRAGMDIMSSTSQDLDQAYQKLYKWCSFEFRQPVKEGLEVSPSLRQATRRLKHARQDLLRSALATLVQTRSSILANAFMSALTMGAGPPTYLPGPIELHAHDPIRYVGDMLAWIHQTVASEREFLTALFDEKEGEGGRRIGQRRRGLEGSLDLTGSDPDSLRLGPGEALVREVLNSNLDGCCRPLRLRIQQTLRSQEGSVTSYRLAHLVQFYRSTMEKTIGSRASLSRTLGELSDLAVSAFADTVERQSRGIERYDGTPEPDLSLPPPLVATVGTLKELIGEFSRSLTEDSAFSTSKELTTAPPSEESITACLSNFDFVLIKLVNPLLDMVHRMVALHISKRPRSRTEATAKWESLLFTCNCLEALSSTLDAHSFAQWKLAQIRATLEATLAEVTQLHSQQVVDRAGLSAVLAAMEKGADGAGELSKVAGAKQSEIAQALAKLDQLTQDDLLSPKGLERLASSTARQTVHSTALQQLTQSYARLVDSIQSPANGYENTDQLIKRTPEEVTILLGL
ncbi:potential intra-Golgi transport complex subunit [Pseudozyma hubeiensis SY62]|uniref:Conserved oligomeric Golgi complex subunit 6 n=1 Tax=Pseudozyma hubeiensis (strain SY62) TaxID=1305764 RepID=R9NZP8_PSEHS|nr:potential intra-Golgi transport complex subunit [Pseudozyma hubeiensis SY62]GAC94333.1 potential intra-Golgi transport complex subunit [Pseudozyma hubeiensis SY62]